MLVVAKIWDAVFEAALPLYSIFSSTWIEGPYVTYRLVHPEIISLLQVCACQIARSSARCVQQSAVPWP